MIIDATNGCLETLSMSGGKTDDTDLIVTKLKSESKMEASPDSVRDDVSVDSDDRCQVSVKIEGDYSDDVIKVINQRENRLTSIIDQLRCQRKLKGNIQRDGYGVPASNGEAGGGGAGGGPVRRCARDAAASPAPAHAPPAHAPQVKTERLSPHDSSASRSRSVTPSTSSYPGTPPERGSPHAPPPPAPHPPRNYSEIMRSLAARYNTHPNDYFHRVNGYGGEARAVPSPAQAPEADAHLNGIWTKMVAFRSPGAQNCTRASVYPSNMDMNTTKTLWSVSRTGRGGRTRRKRVVAGPEHSPLDLSAAGESAAKRARLSASPSVKSEFDGDRCSSDERSGECMCAEARARLAGWSVDDVYEFVSNIDICAEYAPSLREQRIDGAGLPLLTEEHLTGMLQMKLGPALKLKASVALASQCAQCRLESSPTQMPRVNGNSLKAEPRSSTTSPS